VIGSRALLLRLLALLCLGAVLAGTALAAEPESKPTWASLTPSQRQALAPLQQDWARIDGPRKSKWLEVAARFPAMPADERARVQQRMAEWARLSPNERAQARLQFQEVQQISPAERQAKWDAYQALSPDERKTLAQQAKPAARPASTQLATAGSAASGAKARGAAAPASASTQRPVSPTLVQAKPGATTTSMTTRATPPPHQQPGMPKIAATSGYVDPATLLPQRGPQGAAVRTAAASEPAAGQ
jgi:hypothetical protein